MRLLLLPLLLLRALSQTSAACQADRYGDGNYNHECTFPFIYKGIAYNKCTKADNSERWCRHGGNSWGICDRSNPECRSQGRQPAGSQGRQPAEKEEPKEDPKHEPKEPDPTPPPSKAEKEPPPTRRPNTSEPTPNPTRRPKTSEPTPNPTRRPKTSEPTPNPTRQPKTSEPTPNPTRRPKTPEPTESSTPKPTEEEKPESTDPPVAPDKPEPTDPPVTPDTPEPTKSPTPEPSSPQETPEPTNAPAPDPTPEPTVASTTIHTPNPTPRPQTPIPTESTSAPPTTNENTPEPTPDSTPGPTQPIPFPTWQPISPVARPPGDIPEFFEPTLVPDSPPPSKSPVEMTTTNDPTEKATTSPTLPVSSSTGTPTDTTTTGGPTTTDTPGTQSEATVLLEPFSIDLVLGQRRYMQIDESNPFPTSAIREIMYAYLLEKYEQHLDQPVKRFELSLITPSQETPQRSGEPVMEWQAFGKLVFASETAPEQATVDRLTQDSLQSSQFLQRVQRSDHPMLSQASAVQIRPGLPQHEEPPKNMFGGKNTTNSGLLIFGIVAAIVCGLISIFLVTYIVKSNRRRRKEKEQISQVLREAHPHVVAPASEQEHTHDTSVAVATAEDTTTQSEYPETERSVVFDGSAIYEESETATLYSYRRDEMSIADASLIAASEYSYGVSTKNDAPF